MSGPRVALDRLPPGAILPGAPSSAINRDLPRTTLTITNTGDVPVHLTAYFHVFEANPRLRFDRRRAFGLRPDVPSGGGVRIEAGETTRITLVPFGGARVIHGFNALVDGPLDEVDIEAALERAVERGFLHQPEPDPAEDEG